MKMLTLDYPTRSLASDLFTEMDRFLDDWQGAPTRGFYNERGFEPACEITEGEDRYTLSLDVPGMKKEDIKIEVIDNALTISGERKRESKSYGVFKRSFTLPASIEADKAEARYENGVLEIDLPKTPMAKPRQIEIRSSTG